MNNIHGPLLVRDCTNCFIKIAPLEEWTPFSLSWLYWVRQRGLSLQVNGTFGKLAASWILAWHFIPDAVLRFMGFGHYWMEAVLGPCAQFYPCEALEQNGPNTKSYLKLSSCHHLICLDEQIILVWSNDKIGWKITELLPFKIRTKVASWSILATYFKK